MCIFQGRIHVSSAQVQINGVISRTLVIRNKSLARIFQTCLEYYDFDVADRIIGFSGYCVMAPSVGMGMDSQTVVRNQFRFSTWVLRALGSSTLGQRSVVMCSRLWTWCRTRQAAFLLALMPPSVDKRLWGCYCILRHRCDKLNGAYSHPM